MQSPPRETVLLLGYLGALNLLRNAGDPDGDTWSEQLRGAVDRLGALGPLALVIAVHGGGHLFVRHILRSRSPLDSTIRLLDRLHR